MGSHDGQRWRVLTGLEPPNCRCLLGLYGVIIMKSIQSLCLPLVLVLLSFSSFAPAQQLWSGILNTTHGTNWTKAGTGGTQSAGWTQHGSTIVAYTGSAATINNSLASCGNNQYVLLGPGTFSLSSVISFNTSNCVLRGSGADQTFLVFQSGATGGCNGLGAVICIQGANVYPGGNPTGTNWTAGYTQGSNQITLASVSGITVNSTMLFLDQCDDGTTGVPCSGTEKDNGNFYVCSQPYSSSGPSGCAGEAASNAYRTLRSQMQATYATNISGNVVTIADPLVAPNWRSGQSPQVWLYSPVTNSGIENLSVDATAADEDGIKLYGCLNCWVTGNRIVKVNKRSVTLFESAHVDVQQNYVYGAQNSDPYCISPDYTSFLKVEDNIVHMCRSMVVYEGPDTASVFAYNYFINDYDGGDSYMWFKLWTHSAESMYGLYEGNVGNGLVYDNIHGSHHMGTLFRDYYTGWEPGKGTQTNAFYSAAYARYSHVIGSVLGRSGYHTTYASQSASSSAVFILGAGGDDNSVPTDTYVQTSSMRWGNYDTVTAAVRWCGNSSDTGWATMCASTSEIPTGLSVYPLSVPTLGDTGAGEPAMPASFYLSSKPSWWQGEPWPPIGPDVTGGTVYGSSGSTSWVAQSLGGHANDIPALDCFKNIMGGPADGSGGVLTFNANTCYGGTVQSPQGLTTQVH